MKEDNKPYMNGQEEAWMAEYNYRALHKLVKSEMWKMYCDRDFQIVRVEWGNDFRRMLGYKDKNDFPDRFESWVDLLHPDDYDRVMREIDPVLHDVNGNTIFDQEYRLNTKDRGWLKRHAFSLCRSLRRQNRISTI